MAKTTTCPFTQNVNNVDGSIAPADTTSKKTVWTAGANDSVLKSFGLTSTDTSARVVQIFINVGGSGTDRLIGTVAVPALAGSDGATAAIDCLRSVFLPYFAYDAYGNKALNVKASTTLKIACTTTVTTAKEIDAFGEGGDF